MASPTAEGSPPNNLVASMNANTPEEVFIHEIIPSPVYELTSPSDPTVPVSHSALGVPPLSAGLEAQQSIEAEDVRRAM